MYDEIFTRIIKAPSFPENFDWINANKPLSLENLKGHVII